MALAIEPLKNAASNGYHYQALNIPGHGDDTGIRLLLVQPALSETAEIRCNIIHTTLFECQNDIYEHYIALSYVWGDPTKLHTIWVDDVEVTVTASLYCALRDLRDTRRVLRLWADALCINQSDDGERSEQVSVMGEIYRKAKVTIIYLGPLDLESERLLSLSNGSLHAIGSADKLKLAKTVLNRAWFRRVWVFQEFVMSSQPFVQFGRFRWGWYSVYFFLDEHRKHLAPESDDTIIEKAHSGPPNLKSPAVIYQSIDQMDWSREKFQCVCDSYPFSMMRILPSRRGFECTDPRDIIFAHLSFTNEGTAYFDADYTISCVEVFEDFAYYRMKSGKDCRILSDVDIYPSPMRLEGLSSWAPDWTKPKATIPLHVEGPVSKSLAEYHKEHIFGDHHTWVNTPRTLVVLGYVVDSIVACSAPLSGMAGREICSEITTMLKYLYDNFHENSLEEEYECYGAIYSAWKDLLQDDDDEILPSKQSKYDDPVGAFFQEAFNYIEDGLDYSKYQDHQVIDHLMWYFSPGFNKAFFDGRVVARLSSGRLALVPAGTQKSDFVLRLPTFSHFGPTFKMFPVGITEDCSPNYILRPIEACHGERPRLTKDKICQALDLIDQRNYGTYGRELKPETDEFLHCVLIGECVVDNPKLVTTFPPSAVQDPWIDPSKLTFAAIS